MVKIIIEWAKSDGISRGHPSLIILYGVAEAQKAKCQMTEFKLLKDYHCRQPAKWITHVTLRENNDMINMLSFHTT